MLNGDVKIKSKKITGENVYIKVSFILPIAVSQR